MGADQSNSAPAIEAQARSLGILELETSGPVRKEMHR